MSSASRHGNILVAVPLRTFSTSEHIFRSLASYDHWCDIKLIHDDGGMLPGACFNPPQRTLNFLATAHANIQIDI